MKAGCPLLKEVIRVSVVVYVAVFFDNLSIFSYLCAFDVGSTEKGASLGCTDSFPEADVFFCDVLLDDLPYVPVVDPSGRELELVYNVQVFVEEFGWDVLACEETPMMLWLKARAEKRLMKLWKICVHCQRAGMEILVRAFKKTAFIDNQLEFKVRKSLFD